MRVLVVEDHGETRGMIEAVLREAGYAAVTAGTLAEARGFLQGGGLAAIVLDWMLPDGAGPDLCSERRA